ncbi:MAG: MBL fold metallo-hydrolase [Bacilli bacterium]|nr:MBL fold metallo-hydrolase [Bacilli bacterium]
MNIKCISVGRLQANCYILEKNNKVLIIDPGDEFEKIDSEIDGDVVGVLVTHNHFDHVGALKELIVKYNPVLYYHNINDEVSYDKLVDIKEETYKICDFEFEVIYFPGHRNDLCAFYFKENDIMFDGDFIFENGIGRVDLPHGSLSELKESIEKIMKYDDCITLYPGHGNKTNLGIEKEWIIG